MDENAGPDQIAKAVSNVVFALKKAIHKHASSISRNESTKMIKPSKKKTATRRRLNAPKIHPDIIMDKSLVETQESIVSNGSTLEKVLPTLDDSLEDVTKKDTYKGIRSWFKSRILKSES